MIRLALISMEGRAGSFLLVNDHILHAGSQTEGVEVLMIEKALEKYEWLKEYCWKIVPADKDKYTKYVSEHPQRGYCHHRPQRSENHFSPSELYVYAG